MRTSFLHRSCSNSLIMQGLINISAFVLLVAGLASSTPVGDCPPANPEDFHMPDDRDCTIFYKCAHGVPVKFDCPAPLHFNPSISVCDWPDRAGCAAGSGPTAGPSTEEPPSCSCTCSTGNPVTTTTVRPSTTGGPTTTPFPSSTTPKPTRTTPTRPPTTAAPADCDAIGTCPIYDQNSIVVHLPHRTKCDVYCRCDHGRPIEMPCAPGTWFNAALQVCDWPAASGCVPGEGPQPPATTKPTAGPPSSTTTVAVPPRTRCDAVGVCPIYDEPTDIVKHLPHRTRCDVYCRCDHGEPIEMPCAPGTWFNAKLEVCDWPANSGCTASQLQQH